MTDVTELLLMARRSLARGDHQQALPLLRQAARLEPNLFGTQMLLGVCLSACGQHRDGIEALTRAIKLNPDSAQGHFNLGAAFRAGGDHKKARFHFQRALLLDPRYEAASAALKELENKSTSSAPPVASAAAKVETQVPRPVPDLRQEPIRRGRPLERKTSRPRRLIVLSKWTLLAIVGMVMLASDNQFAGGSGDLLWWRLGNFAVVRFLPDDATVLGAGDGVQLWRLADGETIERFAEGGRIRHIAVSDDGRYLAGVYHEGAVVAVRIWKLPKGELVGELPPSAGDGPLAFLPNSNTLAVGTDYLSSAHPLGVQLWSVPEMRLIRAVAEPEEPTVGFVTAIAFSRDGRFIAVADEAGTIQLCSMPSGMVLRTIGTANMLATSLAFAPDNNSLAYGGMAGSDIAIEDIITPDEEPQQLSPVRKTRGRAMVTDLAYSSNGELLATAVTTGERAWVEVFSLLENRSVASYEVAPGAYAKAGREAAELRSVHFSPDNRHLAWGGGKAVLVSRIEELTF